MAGSEIIFDVNRVTSNVQFPLTAILQVHREQRVQVLMLQTLNFSTRFSVNSSLKEDVSLLSHEQEMINFKGKQKRRA